MKILKMRFLSSMRMKLNLSENYYSNYKIKREEEMPNRLLRLSKEFRQSKKITAIEVYIYTQALLSRKSYQ